MRRIVFLIMLALVVSYGLFLLYPGSRIKFTLNTRDGKNQLVYYCHALSSEAQTLVQAELAHAYFQDQLSIMAPELAAGLLDAMSVADKTVNLSDLESVGARNKDKSRDLLDEVDRKFGCRTNGLDPS